MKVLDIESELNKQFSNFRCSWKIDFNGRNGAKQKITAQWKLQEKKSSESKMDARKTPTRFIAYIPTFV